MSRIPKQIRKNTNKMLIPSKSKMYIFHMTQFLINHNMSINIIFIFHIMTITNEITNSIRIEFISINMNIVFWLNTERQKKIEYS